MVVRNWEDVTAERLQRFERENQRARGRGEGEPFSSRIFLTHWWALIEADAKDARTSTNQAAPNAAEH